MMSLRVVSEEVWKVVITGLVAIVVAVIGGLFGRKPKTEAFTTEGGRTIPVPSNLDPNLLTFVERLVNSRVEELTSQRDAAIRRADTEEKRADDAEREVHQLRLEVASLRQRVSALEGELATLHRSSESRTRINDRETEG